MQITVSTKINASAQEIYDTWLSSSGHSKMTGGKASVSEKEGEKFSAWDGYITGNNIKLEAPTRIVQSWRTSDFVESEQNSNIDITLNEDNGVTELTLIHTNLPEHGEQYIEGWEEHYFTPMKAYFTK